MTDSTELATDSQWQSKVNKDFRIQSTEQTAADFTAFIDGLDKSARTFLQATENAAILDWLREVNKAWGAKACADAFSGYQNGKSPFLAGFSAKQELIERNTLDSSDFHTRHDQSGRR